MTQKTNSKSSLLENKGGAAAPSAAASPIRDNPCSDQQQHLPPTHQPMVQQPTQGILLPHMFSIMTLPSGVPVMVQHTVGPAQIAAMPATALNPATALPQPTLSPAKPNRGRPSSSSSRPPNAATISSQPSGEISLSGLAHFQQAAGSANPTPTSTPYKKRKTAEPAQGGNERLKRGSNVLARKAQDFIEDMLVMQIHPPAPTNDQPTRRPRSASTATPQKRNKQQPSSAEKKAAAPTKGDHQNTVATPSDTKALRMIRGRGTKSNTADNRRHHNAAKGRDRVEPASPEGSRQSVGSSPLVDPVDIAFAQGTDGELAKWVGEELGKMTVNQQQGRQQTSRAALEEEDVRVLAAARDAFLDECRLIAEQDGELDEEDLRNAREKLAKTAKDFPPDYNVPPNLEASSVFKYPPPPKPGQPASLTRVRLNLTGHRYQLYHQQQRIKSRGGSYLMSPMPPLPAKTQHHSSAPDLYHHHQQQHGGGGERERYPRRSGRGRNKKKDDLYVPLDSDDEDYASDTDRDSTDEGIHGSRQRQNHHHRYTGGGSSNAIPTSQQQRQRHMNLNSNELPPSYGTITLNNYDTSKQKRSTGTTTNTNNGANGGMGNTTTVLPKILMTPAGFTLALPDGITATPDVLSPFAQFLLDHQKQQQLQGSGDRVVGFPSPTAGEFMEAAEGLDLPVGGDGVDLAALDDFIAGLNFAGDALLGTPFGISGLGLPILPPPAATAAGGGVETQEKQGVVADGQQQQQQVQQANTEGGGEAMDMHINPSCLRAKDKGSGANARTMSSDTLEVVGIDNTAAKGTTATATATAVTNMIPTHPNTSALRRQKHPSDVDINPRERIQRHISSDQGENQVPVVALAPTNTHLQQQQRQPLGADSDINASPVIKHGLVPGLYLPNPTLGIKQKLDTPTVAGFLACTDPVLGSTRSPVSPELAAQLASPQPLFSGINVDEI